MDRKVFRDGFLKSKIDEYKYGTISAEEFCHAMKDLKKYPGQETQILDRAQGLRGSAAR